MLFLFRILYQVKTNIIRSIMKDSLTIHISYKKYDTLEKNYVYDKNYTTILPFTKEQ